MKTLVVGASGATGRLLVGELLRSGTHVIALVRSPEKLSELFGGREGLSVVTGSLLDMNDGELASLVNGCDAVASCLGHNMTFRGIFCHPRRLVTEATVRLCKAIAANQSPNRVKFVLMNTAGNSNRDLNEHVSPSEKAIVALIRLLLPPHADNEDAADYLRTQIGTNNPQLQWTVVRPDTLINADTVTEYTLHPSPTRSAIFKPGKTSRINTAHCMAQLILSEDLWEKWRGQMPVVYNRE